MKKLILLFLLLFNFQKSQSFDFHWYGKLFLVSGVIYNIYREIKIQKQISKNKKFPIKVERLTQFTELVVRVPCPVS